jgi:uncharacterized protein YlxW (UPF0749 family)
MDKACVAIAGILTVLVLGLVAMFRDYKVKASKKTITLEKNDKEQKERIVELEKKNGKEQKEIDKLNQRVENLEKKLKIRS